MLGNKFNSKPQQVDKNTKDIEELKKTISGNEIYNANIEISQDATAIVTSNVKNWSNTITNGYIMDTVGKLFKIVSVSNNTIYIDFATELPRGLQGERGETGAQGERGLQGPQGVQGVKGDKGDNGNSFIVSGSVNSSVDLPDISTVQDGTAYFVGTTYPRNVYVAVEYQNTRIWQNQGSLQGPQGPQGVQGNPGNDGVGISSITAGTPTQSGTTTVTPITATLTNGNTQTFNVTAENGQDGATGPQGPSGINHLYRHLLRLIRTSNVESDYEYTIFTEIYTNTDTPITLNNYTNFFYTTHYYLANGNITRKSDNRNVTINSLNYKTYLGRDYLFARGFDYYDTTPTTTETSISISGEYAITTIEDDIIQVI